MNEEEIVEKMNTNKKVKNFKIILERLGIDATIVLIELIIIKNFQNEIHWMWSELERRTRLISINKFKNGCKELRKQKIINKTEIQVYKLHTGLSCKIDIEKINYLFEISEK